MILGTAIHRKEHYFRGRKIFVRKERVLKENENAACVLSYGHLLGKGWPLGFRLWCITVSLSLSHWYPGSGVVLDLCTLTYQS